MTIWLMRVVGAAIACFAIVAAENAAQVRFGDDQAMIEFQRAADAYAFGHRHAQRRGEGPAPRVEGTLFTPLVADAFRKRIRTTTAGGSCTLPDMASGDFSVPGVNAPVGSAPGVPPCIAAILPRLPTELEYRIAGVALVLADAHLHIVVDVLHAAFPRPVAP